MFRKKRSSQPVIFEKAKDVERMIKKLVKELKLDHVQSQSIYCMRSIGSSARAYARIWGLSRIFQIAAGFKPTYVIEVLSERYDKLSREEQIKVLIHELMHIPKTFSGALLSHKGRYHRINHHEVEKIFKTLKMSVVLFLALSISSLFFLLHGSKVSAQTIEHIESFDVDAVINTDGTVDLSESIEYDFGPLERHGIYRNIPYTYINDRNEKYRFNIDNIVVTDENDQDYNFQDSKANDELSLKIGDANSTVNGIHTYVISYHLKGALFYFSDHDEFFWNITGNGWGIPINEVNVKVTLPEGQIYTEIPLKCFTGAYGSTEENCQIQQQGGVITIQAQSLGAYEGLTIVVGFPKGIVAELPAQKVINFRDTLLGKILFALAIIGALFWYLVYPIWIAVKWYRYGRDPDVGYAPTAYFDAPETKSGRSLTPAETGTLRDEMVNLRDVLATVVDLARRGHITINEKKKDDFWLQKNDTGSKKEPIVSLNNFEIKLLTDLFPPDKKTTEIRLKDKSLVTTVAAIEKMIYEGLVADGFFPKNPQSIRTFYALIGVLGVMSFNLQLALSAFIFGRAMPRKTLFGAQQGNKAKGLFHFLKSQERQIAFEAKKNPEFKDKQVLFEKFLSYAIAFGVEKIWMERFKDINLKQPEWYQTYHLGAFTTNSMMNGLQSSFKSFNTAATPTRSSTGHPSGFSGRSYAGVGRGGGGGSW